MGPRSGNNNIVVIKALLFTISGPTPSQWERREIKTKEICYGSISEKAPAQNRRVRFGWLYGVISALLILAAVVGGCIVFFRVDTIEVQGNSRYTQQEIVEASGVQQGDNMFLLNKFEIIDKMLSQLTYLDDVTIRRGLPSTLKINVTECTVAGVVRNGDTGEWWLVSSGGKLLERRDAAGR